MLTDHDLQAELAVAFREQADPVTQTAVDSAGVFGRAVRSRRRRAAVRAASVLAVVAVAVGASVVSRIPRPELSSAGQPPGLLLDAVVAAPPPARAAVSGMPRYYVTAGHGRPVAEVRDAASGKTLSVVPLPGGIDPKLSQVAAAGNDHTFVLASFAFPRTRFYLMHVAAGGRSAWLVSLAIPPLPAGAVADAIAVSPGGRKLAVAVQFSGGQRGAVEVVSLATGAVRRWTTGRAGVPGDLSWADDSRALGFFWQDAGPGSGTPRTSRSGLWLLDTTAPGDNLMSGRRILAAHVGSDIVQSAMLTSDGSRVSPRLATTASTASAGARWWQAWSSCPRGPAARCARCSPSGPRIRRTRVTRAGMSPRPSWWQPTPPVTICWSAATGSAGSTTGASPHCPESSPSRRSRPPGDKTPLRRPPAPPQRRAEVVPAGCR